MTSPNCKNSCRISISVVVRDSMQTKSLCSSTADGRSPAYRTMSGFGQFGSCRSFNPIIAFSADDRFANTTNPHPFDELVDRSLSTTVSTISPYGMKTERSEASVHSYGRLPTNNLYFPSDADDNDDDEKEEEGEEEGKEEVAA